MGFTEKEIAELENSGYKRVTPNNLPVRCITGTKLLLECEHGDHPDYKFPVKVELVGSIDADHRADASLFANRDNLTDDEVRGFFREEHAVIYCDGYVVLTMHEANYSIWRYKDGKYLGGRYNSKDNAISSESLKLIQERFPRKSE